MLRGLALSLLLLGSACFGDEARNVALADRSVYRVSLLADGAAILGSAAVIAVPHELAGKIIHPRCPCDPSEVPVFDRFAIGNHSAFTDIFSDVEVGAVFLAPIVIDAFDVGFDHVLVEDLVVYGEALMVNGALVQLAKYLVQRPLPRTYAGDEALIALPRGYRSFYSGHESLAMAASAAFAMTWTLRHGKAAWPWLIAAAVGVSVGVERVLAGRHFPSDVAVGAVMGTAVGIVVPLLHVRRAEGSLAISPLAGGAALSFTSAF